MSVQLWTPETLYDSHGTPYHNHMARRDDSTEDDMLYVQYADYKAEQVARGIAQAKVAELQKALRTTMEWIPANVPKLEEHRLLALAYPPQSNPEGDANGR